MGILQDLFQVGIDTKETIPAVNGDILLNYHFLCTRKQWIRKHIIEHEIEGNIKIGISKYSQKFTKWSIHFTDIECRKKTNFIPEYYILWDYVQRANFFMSTEGKITTHGFTAFEQERIYKEKIKKISQYIQEEPRKKEMLNILKKSKKNLEILAALLNINPVMQLLCREFKFYHTYKKTEDRNKVKPFYTYEVLNDYFGADIHLPIKKISVLDNRNKDMIAGSSVGGVDKGKIREEDFFRYIKKIAGKVAIGRELLLDYSEYYQYDKGDFWNIYGFEQAENYIQTAISEAWFLEEQIKMNRIKKQDYGSR